MIQESVVVALLPVLQQYTYLDLTVIVQEREEKEPNAYHAM